MAAPESGVPSSDSPPGSSAPPIAEPAMPSTSVAIQLTPGKAKAASMRRRHQRVESDLSNAEILNRVDEARRLVVELLGHNPGMLGNAGLHAEHENVAGEREAGRDPARVPARGGKQRLRAGHVAPVARIGRHCLRLVAEELAPQPANEPQAIAAHPLHARLVVIGRAGPGPRGSNNGFACYHYLCR